MAPHKGNRMSNIIEDAYNSMHNKQTIPNLTAAIAVFEKLKADHDAWYMRHDRVSMAMMSERETLTNKCDWAIKMLSREIEKNSG